MKKCSPTSSISRDGRVEDNEVAVIDPWLDLISCESSEEAESDPVSFL